ncbi:hypothetical protein CHUAL_012523 [Chamberlinius hualienensis]
MWLKVLLLLLCLFVLFLISRIVETTLFLETGFLTTSLIDPLSLGVRELKRILKSRGMNYVGVLEKQELTSLVLSSGHLSEGELVDSSSTNNIDEIEEKRYYFSSSSTSSDTHFTCGSHFYEEVEDTKDSIWLLQIQPTHSEYPLLDDYNWKQVRTRLKPFGLRTGFFDCHRDPKLCQRKGWFDRQLVLALPQGVHHKDNVVYKSFRSSSKWGPAVSWVRDSLNTRLKVVQSSDEVENVWLRFDSNSGLKTDVRMLLILPNSVDPPLFYSALSTKFSGRVSFGVANKIHADPLFNYLPHRSQHSPNTARYVIIVPEGVFEYGTRAGEHINFKRMELMLRTLEPEMNDVFVWSLGTVNLFVLFDIFLLYDKMWKHTVRCFWTLVKHNSFLFLLWWVILGLGRFQLVEAISNLLLKIVRHVTTLDTLSTIRNDFVFWKSNSWLVIIVVVMLCFIHAWLRKKWFPLTIPNGNDSGDFVSVLSNLFFPPVVTLRPVALDSDMTLEMDRLLGRLAMPNLWLQPANPRLDYLDELPVWRHRNVIQLATQEDLAKESSCGCSSSSSSSSSYVTASESEEPANRSQSSQSVNPQRGTAVDCCVRTSGGALYCQKIFRIVKKFVLKSRRLVKIAFSKNRQTGPMKKLSKSPPVGMVLCSECAICLESYRNNELICGLPCGHNYHQKCIINWIVRDHHQCPSCRWPTYNTKHRVFHTFANM